MGTPVNRRVALARIPQGMPRTDDFTLVDEPIGTPGTGELLLRTIWLSMDPYQRNWMGGARNYGTAAAPGATVIGRAVSEVVASNDLRFVPGDIVCGETGWQTHPVVSADALPRQVALLPLTFALAAVCVVALRTGRRPVMFDLVDLLAGLLAIWVVVGALLSSAEWVSWLGYYNRGTVFTASDGGGLGQESSKSISLSLVAKPVEALEITHHGFEVE